MQSSEYFLKYGYIHLSIIITLRIRFSLNILYCLKWDGAQVVQHYKNPFPLHCEGNAKKGQFAVVKMLKICHIYIFEIICTIHLP